MVQPTMVQANAVRNAEARQARHPARAPLMERSGMGSIMRNTLEYGLVGFREEELRGESGC